MSTAVGLGAGVAIAANLINRYLDGVDGQDRFAQHTNTQHKLRFISGMHEPFMPTEEEKDFVANNFPEYRRLLPESKEDFLRKRSIRTPVRILPLTKEMKDSLELDSTVKGTVVVGGPPALLSSVLEKNITYVNDTRQVPIADGSAWHLEWDSPSEAPTVFRPHVFMLQQIKRAILPETLKETERTGLFSWRSLDWVIYSLPTPFSFFHLLYFIILTPSPLFYLGELDNSSHSVARRYCCRLVFSTRNDAERRCSFQDQSGLRSEVQSKRKVFLSRGYYSRREIASAEQEGIHNYSEDTRSVYNPLNNLMFHIIFPE